jgi:hypothetical protein
VLTPAGKFSWKWAAAALVAIGLFLGAYRRLVARPRAEQESIAWRIGYICAFYCVLGVGTVCWGAFLAFLGRIRKRSPKKCRLAGETLLLPLGLQSIGLGHTQLVVVFLNLWLWSGILAGCVCQKIVYPRVTTAELSAPEPPLLLFPK